MKFFQNFDLSRNPFNILLIFYFRFFENFDRNFLSCQDVSTEPHLSESAFT